MKKVLVFFVAAMFMSLTALVFPMENTSRQTTDAAAKSQIVSKLNGLLSERQSCLESQAQAAPTAESSRNLKGGKSVGFNSNDNALTVDEAVLLATAEMNEGVRQENFFTPKNTFLVTDFSAQPYIFISFAPYGSAVMSLLNYETVEINFFDKQDYSVFEGLGALKYIPTAGLYSFDGERYENALNNYSFRQDQTQELEAASQEYTDYLEENYEESVGQKIALLSKGGGGSGQQSWDVDITNQEITADVEVPHAWFFKYNRWQFSYMNRGSDGICEYIAFLMLAEYQDFFGCAGYFSDSEITKYVTTRQGSDFASAIPNVADTFCEDLYEGNSKKETLDIGDLNDLLKSFMSGKSVSYDHAAAYWMFGNPKDVINKGRPDMMCGMLPNTWDGKSVAHNIIAYGYFTKGTYKNKYLTHYGWDGKTQCIVSRPFLSGYDWSIINKSPHSHRYIFNVNGDLKCGCESN